MKTHKITLNVIDWDDLGIDAIINIIESNRYHDNSDIVPKVLKFDCKTIDIGDWHDDHPLNKNYSYDSAILDYFYKD